MQDDVNLTPPPQTARSGCSPETVPFPDATTTSYSSHFANAPFRIDDYIGPKDVTCPPLNKPVRVPQRREQYQPAARSARGRLHP